MEGCRLDARGLRISTFWGIGDAQNDYVSIDLRNNCLRNFEYFGTHPSLAELRLDDNCLESFLGLTRQPYLAVFDLRGNPIASHPWYRIMALLVVGFSITTIDGVIVSEEERDTARAMGSSAALAVSYGWRLHPGERTAEEYRRIILECKEMRRRDLLRQLNAFRTVSQALKQHRKPCAVDLTIGASATLIGNQRSPLSDSLSTRVEYFGHASSDSRSPIQLEDTFDLGHVQGLTGRELRLSRCILFADGIRMRTNVVTPRDQRGGGNIRVSLMFEASILVFLAFISRARLAELDLSEIAVEYHSQNTLCIRGGNGATFDCFFEDSQILRCIYKLLYLWRGMRVPPLRHYNGDEANTTLPIVTDRKAGADNCESLPSYIDCFPQEKMCQKMFTPLEEGTTTTIFLPPSPKSPLPTPEPVSLTDDITCDVSPFLASPNFHTGSRSARSMTRDISRDTNPHSGKTAVRCTADADFASRDVNEEHKNVGRDKCEVLRSRTLLPRRQRQPPPPSRIPRRSCSSVFVPSVPRSRSSNASKHHALSDSDTTDVLMSSPAFSRISATQFPFPYSDSS